MAVASIAMQAGASADWGIISLALAPSTATAAIADDTSLAGGSSNTVSTKTVAMTLGASANYLLVFVIGDNTSDLVTGVTYNAVDMTQLAKVYPGSSVGWLYAYGLASPTTGSAENIIVSASGSCSSIGIEAQSYANCAANQPSASVTTTFRSQTIGWSTIVPLTQGCWGVSCLRYSVPGVPLVYTATGCGTSAVLRVSQSSAAGDLGSIVDTDGTIPLLAPITISPNTPQWRIQGLSVGRRREEKLA